MDFHRSRSLLTPTLFLALALFLVYRSGGSVGRLVVGGAFALTMGALLVRELRPFRFRVGADGVDLRTAGIRRLVPWHEIDTLVLHQPAHTPDRRRPLGSCC
jgi:hypothetical protein